MDLRPMNRSLLKASCAAVACLTLGLLGCEGGASTDTPKPAVGSAAEKAQANPKAKGAMPIKAGDFSEGIPRK
jgi:hypothetical protein